MIRVSVVASGDIPRILEIDNEAISPSWSIEALRSEVHRDDSIFLVAVDGAFVVGFCILRCMADEGELLRIAVDKTCRRCGTASILLKAALGCAVESSLKTVFLEVREGNEAAIALYIKHGFKKIGQRKDYYSSPVEDAILMSWSCE